MAKAIIGKLVKSCKFHCYLMGLVSKLRRSALFTLSDVRIPSLVGWRWSIYQLVNCGPGKITCFILWFAERIQGHILDIMSCLEARTSRTTFPVAYFGVEESESV